MDWWVKVDFTLGHSELITPYFRIAAECTVRARSVYCLLLAGGEGGLDQQWQKDMEQVPLNLVDRSAWPVGVRPISVDEMEALGIDANAMIYWNGQPIQVRKRLELRSWELAIAVVATLATVIQAVMAVLEYFGPK